MNLLAETIAAIEQSAHSPEDIRFIGSVESGHRCTWAEFCAMADVEYHNGFGAQEVASDLAIVFSDGSSMCRSEYDGSECWEFAKPFVEPTSAKPIGRLVVSRYGCGWMKLADLNP